MTEREKTSGKRKRNETGDSRSDKKSERYGYKYINIKKNMRKVNTMKNKK